MNWSHGEISAKTAERRLKYNNSVGNYLVRICEKDTVISYTDNELKMKHAVIPFYKNSSIRHQIPELETKEEVLNAVIQHSLDFLIRIDPPEDIGPQSEGDEDENNNIDRNSKKCHICDEDVSNIKAHKRNHMIILCSECKLIIHLNKMQRHSCGNEEFKCIKCSFKTNNKKRLTQHNRIMHKNNQETINCSFCNKAFRNERFKMNHEAKNHGCKFKCKHCGKVFQNLRSLDSHSNKIHSNIRRTRKKRVTRKVRKEHKCSFCNYKTYSKTNFNFHLKNCKMKPRVPTMLTGEDAWDVLGRHIISNNKGLGIIKGIEKKLGKGYFCPNLRKELSYRLNQYLNDYECKRFKFRDSSNEEVTTVMSYHKDINMLIAGMILESKAKKPRVVIVCDGDRKGIIVGIEIIDMAKIEKAETGKFKERSSRRVGIAARADGCIENYHNWSIMFQVLNIANIWREVVFSGDFKTISAWTAHQGATAIYACCFCEGYKVDESGEICGPGAGRWVEGPLRTLKKNAQNYYNWLIMYGHKSESAAKKLHSECKNINNLPLVFPNDEEIPILLFMGLGKSSIKKIDKNFSHEGYSGLHNIGKRFSTLQKSGREGGLVKFYML